MGTEHDYRPFTSSTKPYRLLATAGNLVFISEGNGSFDAFNARSGDRVWRYNLGAGVNAPPIIIKSTMHHGRDRRKFPIYLPAGRYRRNFETIVEFSRRSEQRCAAMTGAKYYSKGARFSGNSLQLALPTAYRVV